MVCRSIILKMGEDIVKRTFYTCIVLIIGLFATTGVVYAEQEAELVNFSVEPIFSANQLERGNSFFDLSVKPEEKTTVKVKINNFSEQQQKFAIDVNRAETNGNLVIDYSGEINKSSPSNEMDIQKWVKYPKTVTIPGKKAGIVAFDISVPNQKFDGMILGGIQVKRESQQKKKAGLTTDYDYVLGLMLSQNETKVNPNLELISISPEVISKNAGITVKLKNTQPVNISKVHMIGKIYKEEDQKNPVISREIKDGGIAPSSSFTINFFNGTVGATKPLDAGKYLLKLDFTDVFNKQWHFEQKFDISKKEAQTVNTKVFTVKKDNTLLFIIIGILVALLVMIIIFLIIYFVKRKRREQ